MNRRSFVKNATAAVAFPYVAAPTVLGANDRIEVGFIGVGNRAKWLIQHEDFGDARITAICDIWPRRMAEAAKAHPEGEKWARYADYHELLDKAKVDAVFIETMTHARVLICMHALQAGVDVYAEKPLTL